jgi:hypothetical protein
MLVPGLMAIHDSKDRKIPAPLVAFPAGHSVVAVVVWNLYIADNDLTVRA